MGQFELSGIVLENEESSLQFAAGLGANLAGHLPADRALIVFLSGPLGAGKSTFARGIMRACGVTGPVRSPTYTLLEVYDAEPLKFVHVDLYRLSDAVEARNIGLREYDQPGFVWLVEWPERLAGTVNQVDIKIQLAHADGGRLLSAQALTTAGREVMTAINWKSAEL